MEDLYLYDHNISHMTHWHQVKNCLFFIVMCVCHLTCIINNLPFYRYALRNWMAENLITLMPINSVCHFSSRQGVCVTNVQHTCIQAHTCMPVVSKHIHTHTCGSVRIAQSAIFSHALVIAGQCDICRHLRLLTAILHGSCIFTEIFMCAYRCAMAWLNVYFNKCAIFQMHAKGLF